MTHRPAHGTPMKAPAMDRSAELKRACSQMESLFLNYLFKAMRASLPESGLMGNRRSEKIYTSMLDDRLSREMASERGIGLAAMLHRQFTADVRDTLNPESDPAADGRPAVSSPGDTPRSGGAEKKNDGKR